MQTQTVDDWSSLPVLLICEAEYWIVTFICIGRHPFQPKIVWIVLKVLERHSNPGKHPIGGLIAPLEPAKLIWQAFYSCLQLSLHLRH